MSDSWLRLPDEPEPAYTAFLAYRDLGAGRTVLDAFRQIKRKVGAKQADGTWNRWVSEYRWYDRVRDWDNHCEAQKQAGIDRKAQAEGSEWQHRRSQQIRDDYELAQIFLKQSKLIAKFPVTRKETKKDGQTVIVQPVDPKHLRDASAIARDATAMAWEAIGRGLGMPEDGVEDDPSWAEMKETIGRVYDGKDDPCAPSD